MVLSERSQLDEVFRFVETIEPARFRKLVQNGLFLDYLEINLEETLRGDRRTICPKLRFIDWMALRVTVDPAMTLRDWVGAGKYDKVPEQLALGAKFPNLQRDWAMVSTDPVLSDVRGRRDTFCVLEGGKRGRSLSFYLDDGSAHWDYRDFFAAVRKPVDVPRLLVSA